MNVLKMIPALVAVLSCAAAPAAVNFAKPKVVLGVESLTYKADVEVRLGHGLDVLSRGGLVRQPGLARHPRTVIPELWYNTRLKAGSLKWK